MNLISILFVLILLNTGCGTVFSGSGLKSFSKPGVLATEETALHLSRSRDIKHRIVRKTVDSGQYFFDSYIYDAEFPALTKQQFDSLKNLYGSWSRTKSRVLYNEFETWTIADFLPPAMQAALNLRFVSEKRTLNLPRFFGTDATGERIETPVLLLSNCWGTAYEVLRQAGTIEAADSLSLFYAPQRKAKVVFFDERWSVELRPFAKRTYLTAFERNVGLEPGDVLLVGKDWLQHVAIFVDDDLYFEKAGAGDNALYRLTDWDTLTRTWPPDLHGFSWRRFIGEPLPESSSLFNMTTSLPENVSFDVLTRDERMNFTVELNLDDKIGKPLGATWFERRDVKFKFDSVGRARVDGF